MPPRVSPERKQLTATDRPDRRPRRPAKPGAGRAVAPPWFGEVEAAAFEALAAAVEANGVATASFGHVLALAAVLWTQIEGSSRVITERGATYASETSTGAPKVVARPEVAQRNAALRLLRGYLAELGLTPLAVARVDRDAVPTPEAADDWSRLALVKGPRWAG